MDGLHRTMKMVFLHIGKAVFGALLVVMGAGIIAFIVSPELHMGIDMSKNAIYCFGFPPDTLFTIAETLLIVVGGFLFMCGMWFLLLTAAAETLNVYRNRQIPRLAERKLTLQKRHKARSVELDKRWFNRIDESEKAILDAAPPPAWCFWAPGLHIARLSNHLAIHRAHMKGKKD